MSHIVRVGHPIPHHKQEYTEPVSQTNGVSVMRYINAVLSVIGSFWQASPSMSISSRRVEKLDSDFTGHFPKDFDSGFTGTPPSNFYSKGNDFVLRVSDDKELDKLVEQAKRDREAGVDPGINDVPISPEERKERETDEQNGLQ